MLNPSTRECTKLPLNEIKIEGYWPGFATYHFGYSPLSNEYKVLQFLYLRSKGLGKCHVGFNIITLGTSSWRPLQVDPGHLPFDALAYASVSYRRRSSGSVCLNGALHWIYEKQKVIVGFDIREETFRVMPLPQDYSQVCDDCDDKDNYHFYGSIANSYCRESAVVVEVGGCLGVFVDKSWKQDKIVLWILKDYQNHVWVKETISLMSIDTRSSELPTKSLGSNCNSREYWLVGGAILNSTAKLRSTKYRICHVDELDWALTTSMNS
ncbi:hypothetical protein L3X38_005899 [Prunus dulcis]|uniref:F-box associated beta-propeller type 3 domain-containing protein n=1 Tax=Prunus dulcis TaxID=3755 RepID=A0AAD4ZRX1_PRUDU|nr:hypothetical protein L3X38_005899 [Prunus dulcis]